jgi:chromosome segregation ATPase
VRKDRLFEEIENRVRQPVLPNESDLALLQHELDEAHKTIRGLLRQMRKDQARYDEIARAYHKTVANITEIARQNTMLEHDRVVLEHDRDLWKARAECAAPAVGIRGLTLDLTLAEIGAIRKAMARLHHPDAGGDAERMKLWNAALDPLEAS